MIAPVHHVFDDRATVAEDDELHRLAELAGTISGAAELDGESARRVHDDHALSATSRGVQHVKVPRSVEPDILNR